MLAGETVLSGAPSHKEDPLVSEFKVMHSAAGYFIGTTYMEEYGEVPNTRETGYWQSEDDAEAALYKYQKYGELDKRR
jgi:hypothetical protein